MTKDLKHTYIHLYNRRYLHHIFISTVRGRNITVAESKMLLTILSTEKCKIQELHFEKTLTLPLIEKNKNPPPNLLCIFVCFKHRSYLKSHFHFLFDYYSDTVVTILSGDSISTCISCNARMTCLTKKISISLTTFTSE